MKKVKLSVMCLFTILGLVFFTDFSTQASATTDESYETANEESIPIVTECDESQTCTDELGESDELQTADGVMESAVQQLPNDGFVVENGITYFYQDGQKLINREKFINDAWYYFGNNGAMAIGWTIHSGQQYYYDSQGQMVHGNYPIEGRIYGFDEWTGVLLSGEHYFTDGSDDQWYYYYETDQGSHSKGEMATGWVKHHGNQYYYNDQGQMIHGIFKIGDLYYGFNEWTGVVLDGEVFIDNAWRYFYDGGLMDTEWSYHDGNLYYYNADGSMYYGEIYLNGNWYYFAEVTGIMATGWTDHSGNHYFYSDDGIMIHGEMYLNGQWYYFDEWTGVMATGWTQHDGNTYYYDDYGRMAHGKYTVGGVEYYFDVWTGVLKTGWRYENGFKVFYNSDGTICQNVDSMIGKQSSYFLKVNTATNTVTVFAQDGANGYIIPVKKMICSTGLPGTPTIKGTFTVKRLGYWWTLMDNVYGQYVSQISGSYLFHSAWYYVMGNKRSLCVSEYRKLGNNASHGCVRLTVADAKWIFDNCNGSIVQVYSGYDADPLYKPARPNPVVVSGNWGYDPTDPAFN